MQKGSNLRNAEAMVDITGGRATFYEMLVSVFSRLPDQGLLESVKGHRFQKTLDSCCKLDLPRFQTGADHIQSFKSSIETSDESDVIEKLSVDRTRILRGTGHKELKPPYEGLYKNKKIISESILEIKRFYRKAGAMPDDTVSESPDHLTVELDFMRHLCLREKEQWRSKGDPAEIVAYEAAFLNEHLGTWVDGFCRQVEKHALTDFYRGFCLIMQAFIHTDTAYVVDLAASLNP
jgi:TorA maturation chaperone TorD